METLKECGRYLQAILRRSLTEPMTLRQAKYMLAFGGASLALILLTRIPIHAVCFVAVGGQLLALMWSAEEGQG